MTINKPKFNEVEPINEVKREVENFLKEQGEIAGATDLEYILEGLVNQRLDEYMAEVEIVTPKEILNQIGLEVVANWKRRFPTQEAWDNRKTKDWIPKDWDKMERIRKMAIVQARYDLAMEEMAEVFIPLMEDIRERTALRSSMVRVLSETSYEEINNFDTVMDKLLEAVCLFFNFRINDQLWKKLLDETKQ